MIGIFHIRDSDEDPWEEATKVPQALVEGLWVTVPASSSASGTAGQVAYDADYLYVCTATDTWSRFAKAAW